MDILNFLTERFTHDVALYILYLAEDEFNLNYVMRMQLGLYLPLMGIDPMEEFSFCWGCMSCYLLPAGAKYLDIDVHEHPTVRERIEYFNRC